MEARNFTIRVLPRLFIPAILIFIASGCSSSNQGTVSEFDTNSRADQTYSFNSDDSGKSVRFEVNFDNGEISSLYKDGHRIPDNEIDDYRDMIDHKLNKLQHKSHHISVDLGKFESDMHTFREEMHKMKEEFKDQEFDFKFDSEDFQKGMEDLSKELSGLKDKKIRIEFDSDKFRDEMDNLKKDLDIHIKIDMNNLKENLDRLGREMDKNRDELSHISIDLSGLDSKLDKLNEFIDTLKKEMVKDNLLKNESDKLNVDLDENGMTVNGKEVSPELFRKYKQLYEDHFDKKLNGDNHFRIVD